MATNNPDNRCLSIVLKPVDQENMKIIQSFLSSNRAIDTIRYGLQAGAEKVLDQREVGKLLRESRIEYLTKYTVKE